MNPSVDDAIDERPPGNGGGHGSHAAGAAGASAARRASGSLAPLAVALWALACGGGGGGDVVGGHASGALTRSCEELAEPMSPLVAAEYHATAACVFAVSGIRTDEVPLMRLEPSVPCPDGEGQHCLDRPVVRRAELQTCDDGGEKRGVLILMEDWLPFLAGHESIHHVLRFATGDSDPEHAGEEWICAE